MNYRVRRQGENLGGFPLEELRRRREAGELTGGEYVQAEGASDWQPLDWVLQYGYRPQAPPLPSSIPKGGPNPTVIRIVIAAGAAFFVIFVVVFAVVAIKMRPLIPRIINQARRGYTQAQQGQAERENPETLAAAGKPIVWTTNTLTEADAQKKSRAFKIRQWLEGYQKHGRRNLASDAEAEQFIRVWIARNYGGPEATNTLSLEDESDKLAGNPAVTDPLVLTAAAENSRNHPDMVRRFERALEGFPESSHKAYPRLFATLKLAVQVGNRSGRVGPLDTSALQLLPECFGDGSFRPPDQQEIATIFVNGWGTGFFKRNAAAVCAIFREAGPDFKWAALTLDGEREIAEAWAARGGGYVNTVSEEGWKGFAAHLAAARTQLTAAWNLQPDWPLAPARMIYVSLGDSNIEEMRQWFDRTTTAQIDYPKAWSDLRWGLRPRWYGDENSMLALGVAAVNTQRFDTDVPRKLFDSISDVESEISLPVGQHIYGRDDVWPHLKQMYEGYIAAPSQGEYRDGWRTAYAAVAYFAGKYDVARAQLEALNWKPWPQYFKGWNFDLSLMPLEVAARTGALGGKISSAESARARGDVAGALRAYSDLKDSSDADADTRQFIQRRISQLATEQRLGKGEWVNLLPSSDNDPDWVRSFGHARVLPDGALEIEYGPKGHMLFPRVRAGMAFEVRGSFEVVRSANKYFQAGLVIGMPDFSGSEWYGFRLKRAEAGDIVCLGMGWSLREVTKHTTLNDATNSFDFIFQNGRVTASVNGVQMFRQTPAPMGISVPDNSCLVGLGAFSDSPDTIIRYRDVQLRKLQN